MRATGARALERPRCGRGLGAGVGVRVRPSRGIGLVRNAALPLAIQKRSGTQAHEASHVPSSALRAPSPGGRTETSLSYVLLCLLCLI
ncbi:hypothetical protein EYC56_15715 [Xanthomonas oryzae]|nr:hypothetical protein EYR26_08075 [Xanthomonas oryzae]QBH00455.1 hypothetical protein EYC56_15715 [Xanthomonas oryzae]QBH04300.1 hypothetical protein EYC57_14210 [Xanthomonas oryzae]